MAALLAVHSSLHCFAVFTFDAALGCWALFHVQSARGKIGFVDIREPPGDRVKPGATAARENDPLQHRCSSAFASRRSRHTSRAAIECRIDARACRNRAANWPVAARSGILRGLDGDDGVHAAPSRRTRQRRSRATWFRPLRLYDKCRLPIRGPAPKPTQDVKNRICQIVRSGRRAPLIVDDLNMVPRFNPPSSRVSRGKCCAG